MSTIRTLKGEIDSAQSDILQAHDRLSDVSVLVCSDIYFGYELVYLRDNRPIPRWKNLVYNSSLFCTLCKRPQVRRNYDVGT